MTASIASISKDSFARMTTSFSYVIFKFFNPFLDAISSLRNCWFVEWFTSKCAMARLMIIVKWTMLCVRSSPKIHRYRPWNKPPWLMLIMLPDVENRSCVLIMDMTFNCVKRSINPTSIGVGILLIQ